MSAASAAVSIFEAFQSEVNREIGASPSQLAKYASHLVGDQLSFTPTDPYDVIGKIPGVMHAEIFMEVSRRNPPVNFRLTD